MSHNQTYPKSVFETVAVPVLAYAVVPVCLFGGYNAGKNTAERQHETQSVVVKRESSDILVRAGTLTQEQVSAAAQKGIDGLVAVANQQFLSTVNGLPVDTRALTRKAVEAYLAGDKSNPPVIAVPATAAPTVPAP